MKTLQRDIDAAKANRDRLAGKLAECEAAIIERRATAMTLARDGAEDSALDKAEATIRAAQDRKETIAAARTEVEQQLAGLEKTFAETSDRILREQTAKEVEQLARRWTDICAELVAVAAKLDDYGERVGVIVPEARAAWHFARTITNEIPQNAEMVVKLLRQHGASVIAGHAAAAMPVPPPAYVAPPGAPREPTVQLFCLRSIKWRDGEGQQRTAAQFTDASVPQRLAARALRIGACAGLDHPARKQNHRQGGSADPAHATDLDAEPVHGAAPIYASPPELTVIDRGPPIPMRVSVPRG